MNPRWYTEAVIYSLDVETFADSNGDGIGDIRGLIGRLDYLSRLGVTCLWLNPIHPTPNRDDGYDVTDFYNVHPKLGASWEGFLLAQVMIRLGARPDECYFWGTHQGAELDLLVVRGRQRLGFEFKRREAPAITPSMRIAMADLELDQLTVIHAGKECWPMADKMRAVAATRLLEEISPLRS